jgi:CheY-like chemotaxis protein
VLVVDDLEEQRTLAVRLLSFLGYQVHAVDSGHAAIAYLQQNVVDILLLDLVMEGFDGLDTYREIARLGSVDATVPGEPGSGKVLSVPRVVIASGFFEMDRVREAQHLGVGQVVRKPYTLSSLGRAIRTELDRETGP